MDVSTLTGDAIGIVQGVEPLCLYDATFPVDTVLTWNRSAVAWLPYSIQISEGQYWRIRHKILLISNDSICKYKRRA